MSVEYTDELLAEHDEHHRPDPKAEEALADRAEDHRLDSDDREAGEVDARWFRHASLPETETREMALRAAVMGARRRTQIGDLDAQTRELLLGKPMEALPITSERRREIDDDLDCRVGEQFGFGDFGEGKWVITAG